MSPYMPFTFRASASVVTRAVKYAPDRRAIVIALILGRKSLVGCQAAIEKLALMSYSIEIEAKCCSLGPTVRAGKDMEVSSRVCHVLRNA